MELPVSPALPISLFAYASLLLCYFISFVGRNSYEETSSRGCFKSFCFRKAALSHSICLKQLCKIQENKYGFLEYKV